MKTVTTFTEKMPACWASYLINNDSSGLTNDEKTACDKYYTQLVSKYTDCSIIIDIARDHENQAKDAYFSTVQGIGHSCADYVILVLTAA